MEVSINNQVDLKIKENRIKELVDFFVGSYDIPATSISVAFISGEDMQAINKEKRGKDTTTDILSFEGEGDFLGELIIDPVAVQKQENFYSSDIDQELLFIIIHGLLHLIGFEDEHDDDRLEMIRRGKNILNKFLNINK